MVVLLFAWSTVSAVVRSRVFSAIVYFGVCILRSDQQAVSEVIALEKYYVFLDLRVKM